MSKRTVWAALAMALVGAGCDRKGEPVPAPKPAVPQPTVGAPAVPLSYTAKTANADVSLTLPAAVGRVPALYTKLYAEGRNGLQAFAEGAEGDLEEQRANGDKVSPYRQSLAYTLSAETGRLIGLQLVTLEDTGAAHPNAAVKGLIWDKAGAKELKPADLFAPGADLTSADKALCDAIQAAKQARRRDPALTGDLKTCPKLKAAALTLAPSTVAGKAGGLVALFSPFALSGGAESGYRIAVPLSAIQSALAPAYAGEFAGMPAPGSSDPG